MRFSGKLRHVLQLSPRFLIAAIVFVAIAGHGEAQAPSRTWIFSQGNIITYTLKDDPENCEMVEAVAVRDGKIVGVGKRADLLTDIPPGGSYDDIYLEGKTLLPGFVDGHSHFAQIGFLRKFANLLPPPDGTVTSIEDIQDSLSEQQRVMSAKLKTEVIIGNGYDDSMLEPPGHPTMDQLDQGVSREVPVCIIHQSGHYGVCNKIAFQKALADDTFRNTISELTGDTITDRDGKLKFEDKDAKHTGVYTEADNVTLNGLLGESAFIAMLEMVTPALDHETLLEGEDLYTAQGFTTVQEGRALDPAVLDTLATTKLNVEVVAYAELKTVAENPAKKWWISRDYSQSPNGHFRTGGVKLVLDGSPQGRSAFFKDSYSMPPDGERCGYRGAANYPEDDEKLTEWMIRAFTNNWQVMVHANGDAAIDQLIRAERTAQYAVPAKTPKDQDRRTVLIHGQFLRDDQIPQIKKLNIFPSLFPMHTFYWGDWYVKILGEKRARFISPTKAVQKAGMMFSIHSDAPITQPNSMRLLDSAVNRTTRGHVVLGPDQRISPIVALKALTLWPAYQHFEENRKGSIEVGKNADFVILTHNPLSKNFDLRSLICIQIMETIKNGKQVYPDKLDHPDYPGEWDYGLFDTCAAEQAKLRPPVSFENPPCRSAPKP